MERIFRRTEILLPRTDLENWSVVACDQFSSQPEYWAALDREIGDAPSALRLMFPEAYLETRDQFAEAEKINAEMRCYLSSGVFRELRDSYIYLERTLPGGAVRRGLLGALDLEAYDYSAGSASPIRATEGTIESRLPPRVRVRSGAALEMPHVMVFLDDPENRVIAPLAERTTSLPKLYDFRLSAGAAPCGAGSFPARRRTPWTQPWTRSLTRRHCGKLPAARPRCCSPWGTATTPSPRRKSVGRS